MKQKILIAIAALLVTGGIIWWIARHRDSSPEFAITTVPVLRGDVSESVTATGTIEAIIQVEVGTQVSGIIDHIYVDFNSEVKKGQLIAELDRTLLEAELASSTANMEAAKVEYEYQEKNYNRQKLLYEKQVISDVDFETATYEYLRAKSSYEKSRADMVRSTTNLGYARIYSPIDGVVISRAVDEGQTVASSFSTPTLFTIANDLRKMQVVADVDEADIGQVETGQRVTFTVDAYPNDLFDGTVTQVRLEPTTTSNVVTYEVIINAPNPDLKLKPGLTANVTIFTREERNVLNIPLKALRFTPAPPSGKAPQKKPLPTDIPAEKPESGKTVWVMTDGKPEPRTITTGMDNGVNIVVLSGLNEGENVATDRKATAAAAELPAGNKEESPFMPKPPGKR